MSDTNIPSFDLLDELRRLQAENEALRAFVPAKRAPQLTCKVSAKGAVSVYGLGRFPVTLYKSQWETLIGGIDKVKACLSDNAAQLKEKE